MKNFKYYILTITLLSSCSYLNKSKNDNLNNYSYRIIKSKDGNILEITGHPLYCVEPTPPKNLNARVDFINEIVRENERIPVSQDIPKEELISSQEEISNTDTPDYLKEIISANQFEQYIVQSDENLQSIAIKIYNDVSKWEDIKTWNEDIISNNKINENSKISVGLKLQIKIYTESNEVWSPEGTPYIIQEGDTIGDISMKFYDGYARYLKDIYSNNTPIINNYASLDTGITIYIPPYDRIKNRGRLEW